MKRVSAPKSIRMERKAKTFLQRPLPGPHVRSACVPLSYVLKVVGLAQTMREARKMLSTRSVLVDGKTIAEQKFPIGLMDVVTVGDRSWRIIFNEMGQIIAKETKDNRTKVCRIEGKIRSKGGKIQISLHDGRTIFSKEGKVGDCMLISLPDGKLVKIYAMEPKMNCMIIGGKHVGKKGVIEEIIPGTATRIPQVKCDIGGVSSTTLKGYIFPIGDFKLE